jgi:hypothetical protein
MDGARFDRWARALAGGASRRAALGAVAGAAAAALGLARARSAGAAAGDDATCRCAYGGKRFCQSERCAFDFQCCSRKCVDFEGFHESPEVGGEECGGGRRCLCRFPGARCGKDCACCSGRCGRDGFCK